MSEIRNLSPELLWRNFDDLTQIPRPTGHMEKVQAFLLDFAKKVGVEAFVDPAGNIVMRKPATPGYENRKGVILQAHMDMVPQRNWRCCHHGRYGRQEFETRTYRRTYYKGRRDGYVRCE